MKRTKFLSLLLALCCTFTLSACKTTETISCYAEEDVPESTETTENPVESAEPEEAFDWGVTLVVADVSPTGLTLICQQRDGTPTGELSTGSFYRMERLEADQWVAVEELPSEYERAWTSEAWLIPMDGTTQWTVNWNWIYGELPAGTYRIGKEIMDWREPGDYDRQMQYAEFTLTDTLCGLSLSVQDVTPTGLTLLCSLSEEAQSVELSTGTDYYLEVLADGQWTTYTVEEEKVYNLCDAYYLISAGESVEIPLNWDWLYGELPAGTYRVGKKFIQTGCDDFVIRYAAFIIE